MARIPLPAEIAGEMQALVRMSLAPDIVKVFTPRLVLKGASDVLRLLPRYLLQFKVVAGDPYQVDLLSSPQGPRDNEPPIVLGGVRGEHAPGLVDAQKVIERKKPFRHLEFRDGRDIPGKDIEQKKKG